MIETMNNIIFYIGYIIVILLMILTILYLSSLVIKYPRKLFYAHLGKMAKNEPKTFMRFMIYMKRKYKLKYERVTI